MWNCLSADLCFYWPDKQEPLKQKVYFPSLRAPPSGRVCPSSFPLFKRLMTSIKLVGSRNWRLIKLTKDYGPQGSGNKWKGRNTSCVHASESASKWYFTLLRERCLWWRPEDRWRCLEICSSSFRGHLSPLRADTPGTERTSALF